ncbi:hypothetical protein HQ545_00355 [Candidatus Woesearchaeota archaeon]|nr:hypothetical protein [Candidatus Woesearchaeota archaeon]
MSTTSRMKNICKKVLMSTAIMAASIGTPKPAEAQSSVELMTGHKATTIDVVLNGQIGDKLGWYSENVLNVDYKRITNLNSVNALTYRLGKGVNLLGVMQASPDGITPRSGFMYADQFGDLGVLCMATAGYRSEPDLILYARATYQPELRKGLSLYAMLQDISVLSNAGHVASTQKVRLGLDIDGFKVGVAADLFERGEKFNYNIGVFVKRNL